MTARIIPFPERIPAHSPRPTPAIVLVLPVIRIERAEDLAAEAALAAQPSPDFVVTDFPLIDGSLSSFPGRGHE